jgi:hypothetical protein
MSRNMSEPIGPLRVVFTTDTPDGRFIVLDAGEGLRLILDTAPEGPLGQTVDEAEIGRFRAKSTVPRQAVRGFHGNLTRWLARPDSRAQALTVAITNEPFASDDEDVVLTGSGSLQVMLNYAESASFAQAIARWLTP